jgi:hypothetical protein
MRYFSRIRSSSPIRAAVRFDARLDGRCGATLRQPLRHQLTVSRELLNGGPAALRRFEDAARLDLRPLTERHVSRVREHDLGSQELLGALTRIFVMSVHAL